MIQHCYNNSFILFVYDILAEVKYTSLQSLKSCFIVGKTCYSIRGPTKMGIDFEKSTTKLLFRYVTTLWSDPTLSQISRSTVYWLLNILNPMNAN
jgi:hypothetical protein